MQLVVRRPTRRLILVDSFAPDPCVGGYQLSTPGNRWRIDPCSSVRSASTSCTQYFSPLEEPQAPQGLPPERIEPTQELPRQLAEYRQDRKLPTELIVLAVVVRDLVAVDEQHALPVVRTEGVDAVLVPVRQVPELLADLAVLADGLLLGVVADAEQVFSVEVGFGLDLRGVDAQPITVNGAG
jgi:hypothetical protein